MNKTHFQTLVCLLIITFLTIVLIGGCSENDESTGGSLSVAVVLDEAGDDDNAFNEYTLKGARQTSEELGLEFSYVISSDYESDILKFEFVKKRSQTVT